jgi:hypothetical protein
MIPWAVGKLHGWVKSLIGEATVKACGVSRLATLRPRWLDVTGVHRHGGITVAGAHAGLVDDQQIPATQLRTASRAGVAGTGDWVGVTDDESGPSPVPARALTGRHTRRAG